MARVFIGLPVPLDLVAEAEAFALRFSNLPVRWIAGRNLHVTIIPPREVADPSKLFAYSRELEKVGPMELSFTRVTFGPNRREPRLIWAEGPTPAELQILKRRLEEMLGMEPDTRPFKSHLTLARFRPETFRTFPIQRLDERIDWHGVCDRFVLYRSHLNGNGAEYEILAYSPLITAMGRKRATRRERPASSTTRTTASTSL